MATRHHLEEHSRNVVFIDQCLQMINQSVLNPLRPTSICGWLWHVWPLWYVHLWIVLYMYLILFAPNENADMSLISEMMWAMVIAVQSSAKLWNGLFQGKALQELFKWCEQCYTMEYRKEYVSIVSDVYQRNGRRITMGIRWGATNLSS